MSTVNPYVDITDPKMQTLLDQLTKDLNDQMGIPQTMLNPIYSPYLPSCITASYTSSGAAGSGTWKTVPLFDTTVLTEYPITNHAWWKFETKANMPDDNLVKTVMSSSLLNQCIDSIIYDRQQETFFAKLEDTRPKEQSVTDYGLVLNLGNTYDPWYRNITAHRSTHYKNIFIDNYGSGPVDIQCSVGANFENIILLWAYTSTIKKQPITLVLYTFVQFAYVNKRKRQDRIKFIEPYMASDAKNYDLL